mmetsp:Transcript_14814/g.33881  ORF Transcript_14814/g.33881 Transcript_14814/m.33881 type:complete len:372 (+) Transcript_14814:233-1348(+)
MRQRSDEVGDVHWHLIDLSRIVLLDVAQDANVVRLDEIYRNTLATETSGATDAMDVELAVVRQIVANDKRHLLHIEAAAPHVRRNQHARITGAELGHDRIALLLGHIAVHGGDREIGLSHLVGEPIHLFLRVAKDDRLCDGERVVEVAERIELPLLALNSHKKLLDAFEGELVALDQDSHRVSHELARHLQNLVRQRSRNENHLSGRWQIAVNVIDLLLETLREHLIRLVDHQHLDRARAQVAPPDHVEHAAWRARHRMHSRIQPADVLANALATNARMALHAHVVSERQHHLLRLLGQLACGRERKRLRLALRSVQALQHPCAEDGGLARARLRLCDSVSSLEDGHDGALLNGGRLLKAIGIDATEQLIL